MGYYRKADQRHLEIPNRLNREFTVDRTNKVWAGDITDVWTGQRWVYTSDEAAKHAIHDYIIGYYIS
ncbi:MAG TPA: hypothetical protein DEA26_06615 [Oceanospirillales bacterium]|nr:hypothetical protein [Oceanospirillaceae bacterium]HBS42334.1 hypothetical protein [Oceanospirillales bacterium]